MRLPLPASASPGARADPPARLSRFAWIATIALGAVATGASAQSLLGRDVSHQEAVLPDPMPSVPPPEKTLDFYVSPTTPNRFAVDPASFGIDGRTVVRFMLIVTSSSGVRNVSYEAFRCDSGEQRLLAIANLDGTWSIVQNSVWQPLERATRNRQRPELYSRLCEGSAVAGRTPEQLEVRMRTRQFSAP
jgi:hypothetical protein